jgi:hypothetical protein
MQGIYTVKSTLVSHSTFCLSCAAPRLRASGQDVTGPDMIRVNLNFSKRLTLKAQVGCETLLASGVQAGTDCHPSRGCAAALSESESARLLGPGRSSQVSWTMLYLAAVAN